MHTEWGALDLNFSAIYLNNDSIETEKHNELESIDELSVVVLWGAYIILVFVCTIVGYLLPHKCLCLNSSCGQLRCCYNRKGSNMWARAWAQAARWPRWARVLTFDGFVVLLDWSAFVWGFYVLTAAALCGFFFALARTGISAARATGWMNIVVFALLLVPVSRDSFILKLLQLPFDHAIAHHRILGRVFVICQIVHMSLCIRDWGLDVTTVNEAFGSGNVVPVWGWVTFASTMMLAFFAVEWFRRRVFELFYYSHIFLFFLHHFGFGCTCECNSVRLSFRINRHTFFF